jgi:hypothetical protein
MICWNNQNKNSNKDTIITTIEEGAHKEKSTKNSLNYLLQLHLEQKIHRYLDGKQTDAKKTRRQSVHHLLQI